MVKDLTQAMLKLWGKIHLIHLISIGTDSLGSPMLQLIHLLHLLDASDVYNDVLDASPRGILSRSWHLGKVLATKKVTIKKSELGPCPCKKG